MTVLLIVLACVAAYLGTGWGWARWDMPRAWARAREHWCESAARENVMIQTVVTILLWPFAVPFRLMAPLVVSVFNDAIDGGDPDMRARRLTGRERELAERERRIAELERELGIGKTP